MFQQSRISKIFFLMAFLCFGIISVPAAGQDQKLEYQPEAVLALGWNSIENSSSAGRASCLDPKSYQSNKNKSKDPNYYGTFRLVYSKTDIEDGFGLNSSASYRGLVYKASGSVKYAQSKQVSSQSTNASGFVTVETRSESLLGQSALSQGGAFVPSYQSAPFSAVKARLGDIRLSNDYVQMLKSNPGEFFRQCGDGFVMDIYYGGRLNIFATLTTDSETSRKKLEASLKGSGGVAEISIDGFISNAKNSGNTEFNASYMAVGSDGSELAQSR